MRKNETIKVKRSLAEQIQALDDHLYNLRILLSNNDSPRARLKEVASILRVLVCRVSGNNGLLCRILEELNINDTVTVRGGGRIGPDHPLSRGLDISYIPLSWPDFLDSHIPIWSESLRKLLWFYPAVYLQNVTDSDVTHEKVIRMLAEQIGGAHEDDSISIDLLRLQSMNIVGLEIIEHIILFDAALVLHVAERVLRIAGTRLGYVRQLRDSYGDLTIIVTLVQNQQLLGSLPIFELYSYVSEIAIQCEARPGLICFTVRGPGTAVREFVAPFPASWQYGEASLFAFSYSSSKQLSHTRTNSMMNDNGLPCPIGYIYGKDMQMRQLNESVERKEFLLINAILTYERIWHTSNYEDFQSLPPDLHGMWITSEELRNRGTFF